MTCRELMTSDPACCVPQDNVVRAAMLMKTHDVGSIPVVSDLGQRKLAGIVTDRDLVLRIVAEQREYYNSKIADVMSTDLVTCYPDDDYDEVVKAMAKNQLRRIPVVDRENCLMGIISQADVATSGPNRKDVGNVVRKISQASSSSGSGGMGAGLMVAAGLGLGAGLLYFLQPEWAQEAADSISSLFSGGEEGASEQPHSNHI